MTNKISRPKALAPQKLCAILDPKKVPYADSTEIPVRNVSHLFQPRAIQALSLALEIQDNEHNVYISGDSGMGRTHFTKSFLTPRAAKMPAPADWVYLHNFEDRDMPIAVSLTAGRGRKLKHAQSKAFTALRTEIPARFDKDPFQKKYQNLMQTHGDKRAKLITQLERQSEKSNFTFAMDNDGEIALLPIIDGAKLTEQEFDNLSSAERKKFKSRGTTLLVQLSELLRKLGRTETILREKEIALQQETARIVLDEIYTSVCETFDDVEDLREYFIAVQEEVIENVEEFIPREHSPLQGIFQDQSGGEAFFTRFEVNLFVDNGKTKGAPLIVEDHPTSFNLLGAIERESEMGSLHTDFTLIKAGAIHKANGGFLVLNVEDLLGTSNSWEGLLRALRAGASRIEDPADPDQVRTRTVQPAPIPLSLRVLLIGTDEHYEMLLFGDDRFSKHFKIRAHLQLTATRNAANIRNYLIVLGEMMRDAKTLPFTQLALAGLVDYASLIADDQKELTLYMPVLRERIIEASATARMNGRKKVCIKDLQDALTARNYRANLMEDEFMTDYDRQVIKVETDGFSTGCANGLAVSVYGDYELGLPHQISCTVGVGHGGILDLEREAQLGGPIHTKGMMIIKSYLVRLFAQDKPIVLTGSLCFEQSYAGIEGDSASGAELAALLSALGNVPIDLSLAFTGAVSQNGTIMAVGGVNRKIEGFFEVCRRRKLTGKQGVILPADNVVNLMLKDDVVQAVRNGEFHIYPVKTIEEALRILTGMNTGTQRNGKYPSGTLYHAVNKRLAEFADLAFKMTK